MNAPVVPPRVYWLTGDGTRVDIPRVPTERAYAIPGPVTRPDGSVIYVYEETP